MRRFEFESWNTVFGMTRRESNSTPTGLAPLGAQNGWQHRTLAPELDRSPLAADNRHLASDSRVLTGLLEPLPSLDAFPGESHLRTEPDAAVTAARRRGVHEEVL
jgi:hypothetical protein